MSKISTLIVCILDVTPNTVIYKTDIDDKTKKYYIPNDTEFDHSLLVVGNHYALRCFKPRDDNHKWYWTYAIPLDMDNIIYKNDK